MVQAGVEPATLALLAPRSNQLSYKTFREFYIMSLKRQQAALGLSVPI